MCLHIKGIAVYYIYAYMNEKSAAPTRKKNETPLQYLDRVANDDTLPVQVRLDAAKALLPYTAKKTSETLETINRSYVIRDERLSKFSDDQLRQLAEFITALADFGDSGTGDSTSEIQHD